MIFNMVILGIRTQELRKSRKMSQVQMAMALNISIFIQYGKRAETTFH